MRAPNVLQFTVYSPSCGATASSESDTEKQAARKRMASPSANPGPAEDVIMAVKALDLKSDRKKLKKARQKANNRDKIKKAALTSENVEPGNDDDCQMCGSNDKEAEPAAPEAKVAEFAEWALVVPTDVSMVQCSTLAVSKDVKLNTVQCSFWVLILEQSPPYLHNKTNVDRFVHSVKHCQEIFMGETATWMNSREKRSLHLSSIKELYSELSEVILAWWSIYSTSSAAHVLTSCHALSDKSGSTLMSLASAPARLCRKRCFLPRTRFQRPEGSIDFVSRASPTCPDCQKELLALQTDLIQHGHSLQNDNIVSRAARKDNLNTWRTIRKQIEKQHTLRHVPL
jgi:hypothetical protein